jgi:hypothetical protein
MSRKEVEGSESIEMQRKEALKCQKGRREAMIEIELKRKEAHIVKRE